MADTSASEVRRPARPPAVRTPAIPCDRTNATPADARPPVLARSTRPWLGQGDLWTAIPDYPAVAGAGSALVLKFPVVTLTNGTPTSAMGPPTVSATRSDAPGQATGQVGGFARTYGSDALSFWPTVVEFPEAGCWTVTSTLGAAVVQFMVGVNRP